MSRSINAVASRVRRKRLLKKVRGFRGARSKLIRTASDALDRAKSHSYVGRKQKKRQFRSLWTVRINAACRSLGINYSNFIHGLNKLNISLNRKILSNMAIEDFDSFKQIVEKVKAL